MKTIKFFAAALAVCLLAPAAAAQQRSAAWSAPAEAATRQGPFLGIGGETTPPMGWVQFCRDNAEECREPGRPPRDAAMTRARWTELTEVNRRVNAAITPMTDQDNYGVEEYWTYPANGRGDCEDYALLKRRQLIDRGWPESALLMTVARDTNGGGHAVLTVRTTEGDFILDNVRDEILAWHQTGYQYIKRQSQWSPNVWVSLPNDIGRDMPVATRR